MRTVEAAKAQDELGDHVSGCEGRNEGLKRRTNIELACASREVQDADAALWLSKADVSARLSVASYQAREEQREGQCEVLFGAFDLLLAVRHGARGEGLRKIAGTEDSTHISR